jgi:aminoglycoside phosphotransferase (APT) family kinase protein
MIQAQLVGGRLLHLVNATSAPLAPPTSQVSPPYDSGLVILPFTSGTPSLSSETALIEVVRHVVGAQAAVRVNHWHVRRQNYVVASVETQEPALRLIVKLEVPGERPNRHLDTMAAIARLVRSQTSVPTFDVVAVDTTRQQCPWEYLVVTELAGLTWMELYPGLQSAARAAAQRQIGRAAGQLHSLRFESFGQIGPDGSVIDGTTVLPALRRRAQQRLTKPRNLAVMLDTLEVHQDLFAGVSTPTLCHEDLNPNNLVFNMREGQPELVGILDFESAWASTGESDLARLELWWMMAGTAVRQGYAEVAAISAEYMMRRPLLQLLWCLEYAEQHVSAEHQAVTNGVCAELGVPEIQLG